MDEIVKVEEELDRGALLQEIRDAYPEDYIAPGLVIAYLGKGHRGTQDGRLFYASICRYCDYDGKNVVASAREATEAEAVKKVAQTWRMLKGRGIRF